MNEKDTLVELYGPDDGGWYTTRMHDWIGLCDDLRDPDVRGYAILRALVVDKFKNPVRKLTLATLCGLIPSGTKGKPSSLTRVRGILDNLSRVGLVSTPDGEPLKTSSRAAAAHRPIRIRINDRPKDGYQGWRNAEVKLAFLVSQEAGRNSDPSGRNSDPGGSNSDPEPAPDLPERDLPLVPSFGTTPAGPAPSARSAPGCRQASTGSKGPREGGSAAPATSKPRFSKQQREQVQAFRDLLPRELDIALGDKTPPNVSQAIVTALATGQPRERTVQQLVEHRVLPRWNGYWAGQLLPAWKAERDAGRSPRAPFGPLVAMLKDTAECGNLACDDRVDIHTNQPCTACVTRAQDHRADREPAKATPAAPEERPAVPGPRQPMPECACRNPLPKDGSTVCWECQEQQETEAAGAVLAAQWEAEEAYAAEQAAAGAGLAAEFDEEAAAREALERERRRKVAEEDARLRAEFAQQYPDLAAFSSQGPAPF